METSADDVLCLEEGHNRGRHIERSALSARPHHLRHTRPQLPLYLTQGSSLAPNCLGRVSECTFGKPQKDGCDRLPLSATTARCAARPSQAISGFTS